MGTQLDWVAGAGTRYPSFHHLLTLGGRSCDISVRVLSSGREYVPFPTPDIATGPEEVEPYHIELPEHLADVPLQFIKDRMHELGPAMLASIHEQGESSSGSGVLSSAALPAPEPSHTLAISFLDSPMQQPLLLRVHGLVWAFATPRLANISTDRETENLVKIERPCALSFHLLLSWIYEASPEKLLQALVCIGTASVPSTMEATTELCARHPPRRILERLELLSGLWRNAAGLQIHDPQLWRVLEGAWTCLTQAVGVSSSRGRYSESNNIVPAPVAAPP